MPKKKQFRFVDNEQCDILEYSFPIKSFEFMNTTSRLLKIYNFFLH